MSRALADRANARCSESTISETKQSEVELAHGGVNMVELSPADRANAPSRRTSKFHTEECKNGILLMREKKWIERSQP